jgi:hypothetical protein
MPTNSGEILVDGVKYRWMVYRQPTWTSGVLLGLAILVQSLEPSRRDLILEFSIDRTKHGDMPQHQRFRVSDRRLSECIQSAIRSGWDPQSRGKRFVFQAGSVVLN